MSKRHRTCGMCGQPLKGERKRIAFQREYKRTEWSSDGPAAYLCDVCMDAVRGKLKEMMA